MKKTTAAFIIGVVMFAPLISSASVLDDLRAQVNALTEVVKSLQAKLQAISQAKVSTGTGSAAVSGATQSSSIIVVSPNGGETLTQGAQSSVAWQGGNGQVSIALMKANTTNQVNPTSGNLLVGWIGSKLPPSSSIIWDAKTVCDLSLTSCKTVAPGSYKIMAVSQDANGNLTIWDHKQGKAGNWDVSNAAFSIK
ncbi:MAG: hypothetical protein HZB09_00955 [Candidatus Yonathbacteria bacterium]|nr:hypothetical protein [Candidatus Yonathbacteria bacterium]